jgi:maltose O-acetyltransferase
LNTSVKSFKDRAWRLLRSEIEGVQPAKICAGALSSFIPQLTFNYVRTSVWRSAGLRLGERSRIMGDLNITGPADFRKLLAIGDDTLITGPLRIDLAAEVTIGSRVRIGHDVLLLTVDHEIGSSDSRCAGNLALPIRIGDGAWLSSRCVVLPGISIGEGAIVAAGAVVTHDVPPHTLVAGVPARVVRSLQDTAPRSERFARLDVHASETGISKAAS